MSKLFARFVKDESGATAIEYGLIAALIALAIMVGARAVGNQPRRPLQRCRGRAGHSRRLSVSFQLAGKGGPSHGGGLLF